MKQGHSISQSEIIKQANKLAIDGYFAEARDRYYQALCLDRPTADMLLALGVCCYECNRIDEAIAHTRAGLALGADEVKSNMQLGLCTLLLGYAEQGWAGFAYRKKMEPRVMPAAPPIPEWTGAPLHGEGIVLIREQGFGDIIQFVRYAPQIRALGGQVYLDVHAPLRRLFAAQTDFGVTLSNEQPAQISRYAYFMDLPRLFGDHPHETSVPQPYIRVPEHALAPELEPALGSLRIGLAWAGSVANNRDKLRSVGLEALQPVLGMPGCRFFSLLNGARAQELASAGKPPSLTCLGDRIHDFMDLAIAIDKMDLVISVDTAVAHLAGAMGKPVWMLVCTPADWRWGASGSETAWYPSMRMFRQPAPGNWQAAVEDLATALSEYIASKTQAGKLIDCAARTGS
jgi:hypothetical protein